MSYTAPRYGVRGPGRAHGGRQKSKLPAFGSGGVMGDNPSPFDSTYEMAKTDAGNVRDTTKSGMLYDVGVGANDIGYSLKYDDKGNVSGYDPLGSANPFSKMALLQRSYEQEGRGNTNSYAAQGQLYSGALQNAQDESQFHFNQGNDALQKAFQDLLQGYSQGRTEADNDYGKNLTSAAWERLKGMMGGIL